VPRGAIILTENSEVELYQEYGPLAFRCSVNKSNKVLFARAQDKDELDRWMKALKNVITQKLSAKRLSVGSAVQPVPVQILKHNSRAVTRVDAQDNVKKVSHRLMTDHATSQTDIDTSVKQVDTSTPDVVVPVVKPMTGNTTTKLPVGTRTTEPPPGPPAYPTDDVPAVSVLKTSAAATKAASTAMASERLAHRRPGAFNPAMFAQAKASRKRTKVKIKRSFEKNVLQRLHDIRVHKREERKKQVSKRNQRASIFRPVLMDIKQCEDFMTPLELMEHIKEVGIKTKTDALNYDSSLGGVPSGSRKASCVCRANPNIIFLYKMRFPKFDVTRAEVQKDVDLMKKITDAGLMQLPPAYTDVFDAKVDGFDTFGFLMANVPSLMTEPYKPPAHKATLSNIEGRLRLLNFTQMKRAINDLRAIGKFTKTKHHIHDLQMLLQDEGPADKIGHIWVIDPGEVHATKKKNQVWPLQKLCLEMRKRRTKSLVQFMHHVGDPLATKKVVSPAAASKTSTSSAVAATQAITGTVAATASTSAATSLPPGISST